MAEPLLPRHKADAGQPCSSPLPGLQLLREAEAQADGTAEGQDCRDSPWHGPGLAASCPVSRQDTNLTGIRMPMVSMSCRKAYLSLQRGQLKEIVPVYRAWP